MARRKTQKKRAPKATATFSDTQLRREVDTYTEGIYAVVALINHARWSDEQRRHRKDVHFAVGRRLIAATATGAESSAGQAVELTPDCVIQMTPSLGIVGEAKPGIARTPAVWESNIAQLVKYNADLHGWWTSTGKIQAHDVVALVPMARAIEFKDLVQARIEAGDIRFIRPFAILAFFKSTGAEHTYISLKTEYGRVSDNELNERLRQSVPVRWERLIFDYHDPRFMDAEPPRAYTLWVLWELVFSHRAAGIEPERGMNWIKLDVEVAELTTHVQQYYGFQSEGAHSVEIPRRKWIRRALDSLVVFGMAKRTGDGVYEVRYRRLRSKDMLIKFGQLCFKNRERLEKQDEAKPLIAIAEQALTTR